MILIFDLDGTLVDTYPAIRKTLIELFEKHLPNLEYDEEYLESFFGPPLVKSFSNLTNDKEEVEFLIKEYRRINGFYYEKELSLFPGMIEVLDSVWKKHKLTILSNRVQHLVDVALEVVNIEKYFDLVLGVDSIPKPKPEPDGIYQTLNYFNDKKAVFIGDTVSDMLTAKNAGVISVGVTWALTSKEEFEAVNTDYIVDNYEELIKLLEEIDV